jgi:hypothetical protein
MKRNALLWSAYLILGILTSCKSQSKDEASISDFGNRIEKEILDPGFQKSLFSDTVTFKMGNKMVQSLKKETTEKMWNDIEILFWDTDFIVKPYDLNSNKVSVEGERLATYYYLYNHLYRYVLGVNKNEEVSIVQEVIQNRSPDAPPIPAPRPRPKKN